MRILAVAPQALVLAAALAARAYGQVPYDLCLDRNLHRIPGRLDTTLTFTAEARMQGGSPVILWNAAATHRISPDGRLFLYLHECAHHALGHLALAESPRLEQEADCWSIQAMLDAGLMPRYQLPTLYLELGKTLGDALHLGGQARVRSLQQCLRLRDNRTAWRLAIDSLVAADWTATEHPGDGANVRHQFLAQDSERGTMLVLLETRQAALLLFVRTAGQP